MVIGSATFEETAHALDPLSDSIAVGSLPRWPVLRTSGRRAASSSSASYVTSNAPADIFKAMISLNAFCVPAERHAQLPFPEVKSPIDGLDALRRLAEGRG